MTDDDKGTSPRERITIAGAELVDRVKGLIAEGNVRRLIVRKPDGQVLMVNRAFVEAFRVDDAEARTRFIGYRVDRVKVAIWTFSAMLAGIAGALYVPQVGIINPGEFSPLSSIELVVWVAVGGRATLYGAVIGAIAVNYGKTYFTGAFPEAWLFALGGLFVLVTLFLPQGIAGLLRQLSRRKPVAGEATA